MKMSPEKKQEIAKILQDKGALRPCPRCTNQKFTLLDGYFNQSIQQELTGMLIGGPAVPSVVLVCNNCGYMSQHALGVLGLMPPGKEKDNG